MAKKTTTTKKKKKAGKKAVRKAKARLGAKSPLPHIDVPNLQDILPQLAPDQGSSPDTQAPDQNGQDGTTTTTPDSSTASMKEASMFLQFLLGGGA